MNLIRYAAAATVAVITRAASHPIVADLTDDLLTIAAQAAFGGA